MKICLEAKKMWETSRKIAFSERNQTLENIFQSIFWNATKHFKIFSFPKNIHLKIFYTQKIFYIQPNAASVLVIWKIVDIMIIWMIINIF